MAPLERRHQTWQFDTGRNFFVKIVGRSQRILGTEREQVVALKTEAELSTVGELQVWTMEDVEQLQQVEHRRRLDEFRAEHLAATGQTERFIEIRRSRVHGMRIVVLGLVIRSDRYSGDPWKVDDQTVAIVVVINHSSLGFGIALFVGNRGMHLASVDIVQLAVREREVAQCAGKLTLYRLDQLAAVVAATVITKFRVQLFEGCGRVFSQESQSVVEVG